MLIYIIGLLPLIHQLKAKFPLLQQLWYADNAGAGSNFNVIRRHFQQLKEIRPNFGSYPESLKIILIVPQHNYETSQEAFNDLTFIVTIRYHYLGGFIGEDASSREWIWEKTKDWEEPITD
jgi:hypothetical protein